MGLFSRSKPKIKVTTTKKDGYSGWLKCSNCTELIHAKELDRHLNCCPKCDHHYRLSAKDRIALLADDGTFHPLYRHIESKDPLHFVDSESYAKRLQRAMEKAGETEAITTGICKLEGRSVALGVLNFAFMGGSMGSVVGERITRLIEYAMEHFLPLIIVSASGGARMQESALSLMQMAKTSAALAKFHEKGLPYISVLTNPTLGGVTASFASLGDIIIAEPNALIGFAGPRVVEQVIREKLPPRAQKSEFVLEKGFIDCIVARKNLKSSLADFLFYLSPPVSSKDHTEFTTIEKAKTLSPATL